MSILAGNNLLTPARYGEGTYSLVRLARAPKKPPEIFADRFARKRKTQWPRGHGTHAGVFISRVNLYYGCPGYERSYAVSEDSDCWFSDRILGLGVSALSS